MFTNLEQASFARPTARNFLRMDGEVRNALCTCLQAIPALKILVSEALALFEANFPRSELAVMMHLMGHLSDQIVLLGPLRGHWMYPLESFLGFLKKAAKNRAQVWHGGFNFSNNVA
jgi:hypothetical protein